MNYITLYLIGNETLHCNCGRYFKNEAVYLIRYTENSRKTAFVRCKECFNKELVEEK